MAFPKIEGPNKSTLNSSILTKRDLKARYPFIFGYSRKSAWRLEAVLLRGVPGSKLREGSFGICLTSHYAGPYITYHSAGSMQHLRLHTPKPLSGVSQSFLKPKPESMAVNYQYRSHLNSDSTVSRVIRATIART